MAIESDAQDRIVATTIRAGVQGLIAVYRFGSTASGTTVVRVHRLGIPQDTREACWNATL